MDYRVRLKRPHAQQERFIRSLAKQKIVKAGRRGGKTTGLGIAAVERFLAGRRVLYATPTSDQIQKFWSEVTLALAEPIAAGVYKKNETEHAIDLPGTTQRIRAKTAWNADTLRGDFADELILDEWQLMDETAWTEVGAPMLIDNNGNVTFIYTPPSFHSKSVTKATDPRHASKLFAEIKAEMEAAVRAGLPPRREAFHFTSLDNPHLSVEGLQEVTRNMTALAYRQEILAEETDDIPGAMWKRADIEKSRLTRHQLNQFMPVLARIVVGVDPPGGATECGIVAAAKGMCSCKGTPELHMAVLEDASLKDSPEAWASQVNRSYGQWKADRVIGEKNFGGDMVESTIRAVNKSISYQNVNASRGKAVRAEPVAAKYEQGKVHHVGTFPKLEDEQCNWIPGRTSASPNRMDALVWCGIELLPDFNWGVT